MPSALDGVPLRFSTDRRQSIAASHFAFPYLPPGEYQPVWATSATTRIRPVGDLIIVFPILLGSGYVAGMNREFVKMIQETPYGLRIGGIRRAYMGHLTLRLLITLHNHPKSELPNHLTILCTNAVAYSIQPKNPNTIEGGPLIKYYEDHKLLQGPGLQMIPGGDGEVFNPPLKLAVLMLDQSYVIAEKFEIEEKS